MGLYFAREGDIWYILECEWARDSHELSSMPHHMSNQVHFLHLPELEVCRMRVGYSSSHKLSTYISISWADINPTTFSLTRDIITSVERCAVLFVKQRLMTLNLCRRIQVQVFLTSLLTFGRTISIKLRY